MILDQIKIFIKFKIFDQNFDPKCWPGSGVNLLPQAIEEQTLLHEPPHWSFWPELNLKIECYRQLFEIFAKNLLEFMNYSLSDFFLRTMTPYLQPAVDRQPGHRRGDREVVEKTKMI